MPEGTPDLSLAIRQQEQLNKLSSEFAKLSFNDQVKMVEKFSKQAGIASRTLKGMTSQASKLEAELENIKGGIEKLGIEKGLDAKQMKKYINEAEKLKYLTANLIDIKRLNEGIWSTEAVEQFNKKLEENREELEKHGVDIEKIKELNAEAWNEESITIVTEALREMTNEVDQLRVEVDATADSFVAFGKQSSAPGFSKLTEGYGVIKDMGSALKRSPKQLQEQAKRAGDVGLEFKRWGEHFTKTKAMGGMLGGMFKSMGGAAGGISKLLGGWVGLIAMAVVKIAETLMKIDKFVKDANKAFAMVRGPDIMTKDVAKQFKDFNDQIYRIRDNLEVGLNVDQIREFMYSVSQAGLQVESFNNGITDYRDAIAMASQASRIMGIELPQVGAMMAEMATNFRMDLDKIDRSFIQVTFDAKKSGLTTDRFWAAIQNASAGLAYYGKFLDAASRSMKSLTESQVVGADQAASATQEMFQLFKKNSYGTNAAIIALAEKSGVDFNKRIKEGMSQAENEIKKLDSELNVALSSGASEEHISKLRKEMAVAQDKQDRRAAILNKNAVLQATDLALFTDQTPDILMDLIKSVTNVSDVSQISGNKLIVAMEAMEKFGVSKELTRTLITQQQVGNKYLENIFTGSDGFYTKLTSLNQEQVSGLVAGFNTLTKNMSDDDLAKAIATQTGILENTYGLDPDMAQSIALSAASDKQMNAGLQNIVTETAKGTMTQEQAQEKIGSLLKQQKVGEKYTRLGYKVNEIGEAERKKAAEKTFDEIINQTLSLEEAKKIAEDGAMWQIASLLRFDKISSGVTRIARLLAKKKRSPEEKQLLAQISSLKSGKKVESDKDLANTYAGALLNQKLQASGLEKIEEELKDNQENIDRASTEEEKETAKRHREDILRRKKEAEESLKKSQQIVLNTQKLIEGSDEIAKTVMKVISSDQAATTALIRNISDTTSKTLTEEELTKLIEAQGLSMDLPTVKKAVGELFARASDNTYRSKTYSPATKQGLKTPEMITQPGAAVLHPKEIILPAQYSGFRARPIREAGGGVTGAPANVSKNINITVNATETNLANRIANEIRSHLYREQLSGAA